MRDISKRFQITACSDGFVSVIDREAPGKDTRRLGAALPAHSVETLEQALILIQEVCVLAVCTHGGKLGNLVEPRAPNWPRGAVQDTTYLQNFGDILAAKAKELFK